MKNIFFSLLILSSSSLIYSVDFKRNVQKKEELQVLDEQKISSLSDEEEMDFLLKEEILNDIIAKQRFSSNGWKVAKGLVGLWFGIKFFFCGSTGVIFLTIFPDHILPQASATLSPVEKFLTNRFLWLSLSSTLTIFSLWLLKKSATNLYQGLYGIEDTIGSFEKNL